MILARSGSDRHCVVSVAVQRYRSPSLAERPSQRVSPAGAAIAEAQDTPSGQVGPADLAAWDNTQAEALRRAIEDATSAPLVDRERTAARVNSALADLSASEANGRALLRLLEAPETLDDLVDAQGRPCRLEAVRALLRLGYPWALEIDPDTLAWFRAQERSRRGRPLLVLGLLTAGILAAGGLVGLQLGAFDAPPPPPPPTRVIPIVRPPPVPQEPVKLGDLPSWWGSDLSR